jgi:hypothetical protein
MSNTYVSIPVYLSGSGVDAYTCPVGKRALIKNITVTNETNASGFVSVFWRDNNNVGVGSTISEFPVLVSGALPAYGRVRVLDDFLVIKANDVIKLTTVTTGRLNSLFSIMEQDV